MATGIELIAQGAKIDQWINHDNTKWIFKTTAELLEEFKATRNPKQP